MECVADVPFPHQTPPRRLTHLRTPTWKNSL
jgi:hypothetical protein